MIFRWFSLIFIPCSSIGQVILWTRISWLSSANMLCTVASLSRSLSEGIALSLSFAHTPTVHQTLSAKWTFFRRWTTVSFMLRPHRLFRTHLNAERIQISNIKNNFHICTLSVRPIKTLPAFYCYMFMFKLIKKKFRPCLLIFVQQMRKYYDVSDTSN